MPAFLRNPLLGVTGTNGKTTTTALLGEIFRAAGVHAEVAGNIGRPLTSLVGQVASEAWIVCELSSQQLEDTHTLSPRIAVLLNLEADHLDHHGGYEAYSDAKLRVFRNQTAVEVAVLPRGFGAVPGGARRLDFDADDALPAEPAVPRPAQPRERRRCDGRGASRGLDDDAIALALPGRSRACLTGSKRWRSCVASAG